MSGNEANVGASGAVIPGKGWVCVACGESSESDSMGFAIMHETLMGPGHRVEPRLETVARWARALGV